VADGRGGVDATGRMGKANAGHVFLSRLSGGDIR